MRKRDILRYRNGLVTGAAGEPPEEGAPVYLEGYTRVDCGVSHEVLNAAVQMDFAEAEMRIIAYMAETNPEALTELAEQMFGESEMCGNCIKVKLGKQHDPMVNNRHVCPLCRTVWPGAEPWNRRREAVMATRAKRGLS